MNEETHKRTSEKENKGYVIPFVREVKESNLIAAHTTAAAAATANLTSATTTAPPQHKKRESY